MPASNTPRTSRSGARRNPPPRIAIHNRQKKHHLPLRRLQRRSEAAAALLARRLPRGLDTIEVTLLTPAAIGKVHAAFLDDPAPTDVITFDHGEILVCPAVAERQRKAEGLTLEDEVLTYILHGLLHLSGLDDRQERDFRRMRREQQRLLDRVRKIGT